MLISHLHGALVTVPLLVSQMLVMRQTLYDLMEMIDGADEDGLGLIELREFARGLRPFLQILDGGQSLLTSKPPKARLKSQGDGDMTGDTPPVR